MSPMTRGRAQLDAFYSFLPDVELTGKYYSDRSEAGLVVTEGVHISSKARGWVNVPGIWSDAQEKAWKEIAHRVHAANPGCVFAMQLWHQGRVTHSAFGNGQPFGPSAVAANEKSRTPAGALPCEVPHAMSEEEIRATIQDFVAAAKRAFAAGFDAVQIHAANGYLLHQFLSDKANHRTDRYGGSDEKRATFVLELLAALRQELGDLSRVMLRISPTTQYNDCLCSAPLAAYTTLVRLLQAQHADLAVLEVVEDRSSLPREQWVAPALRGLWKGVFSLNSNLDDKSGAAAIDAGETDIVSIGRPFIANPDLVKRYRTGAPVAQPDYGKLFYTTPNLAAGYTDYAKL